MNDPAAGAAAFDAFRQQVFADPVLQDRLRGEHSIASFIEAAIAIGFETGHRFEAADVEAALEAGRTTWLVTWSPIL